MPRTARVALQRYFFLGLLVGVGTTLLAIFIFKSNFIQLISKIEDAESVSAAGKSSQSTLNPYPKWYETCIPNPDSTDKTSPTLSINTPVDGSNVAPNSYLLIEGKAADDVKLDRFEVFINNNFYEYATIPYHYIEPDNSMNYYSDGTIHSYFKTGKGDRSYKVQVKVCDSSGNSTYSNIITVSLAK